MDNMELNKNNNDMKYVASSLAKTNCDCTGCGICTFCIILAPIVGIFLAPSLALILTGVRDAS